MALTLNATAQVLINAADSTTGWTGPTLAADPDITKEGTNSVSSIVRNNGQQIYYSVTNQDYSNQHLRLWVTTGVYGVMQTLANNGLRFFVYDGANTAYWQVAGIDTYSGGWLNIVVDTANPDSGTATMTSIDRVGFEFGLTSSYKRVVNTWHDYLRYGDGYIGYGTGWDFSDLAVSDTAGGYGITTLFEGVYFLAGEIQIGRATEATTFTESGSVLSFSSAPVASTLYNLTLIGHASSTFDFTGNVITTAGQPFDLNMDDTGIADLTFNGNTVQGAGVIDFRASSIACEVKANTFDTCGPISPQGCTFENNIIANTTASGNTTGGVVLSDVTTITNSKNITFIGYGSNHAIYIPASVTGTINLDNFQFDSPATTTTVYWAGTSGTLTINNVNGSNLSTSAVYSTAGGTISVPAAVYSFTFTVSPTLIDSEWRLYSVTALGSMAGASELDGEENATASTKVYNYSYTSNIFVALQIISQPDNDYEEETLYFTLSNANQNIAIDLTPDINN